LSARAFVLEDGSAGYAGRMVLHELTLAIPAGGFTGVIGPNGAGKTTLLRVLGGSLPLAAGRLTIQDRAAAACDRRELARILAFVPHTLDVPVPFTVAEFALLGRTPHLPAWALPGRRDREIVARALAAVDLAGLEERPLDELSGGERQRALIALALAQEPRILLLDEPTAHLDIPHAWRLMEMVARLNREQALTIVMTTHDLNLAAEFAGHFILLDRGRIAAQGSRDEVITTERLAAVYQFPFEVFQPPGRDGRLVVPRRP